MVTGETQGPGKVEEWWVHAQSQQPCSCMCKIQCCTTLRAACCLLPAAAAPAIARLGRAGLLLLPWMALLKPSQLWSELRCLAGWRCLQTPATAAAAAVACCCAIKRSLPSAAWTPCPQPHRIGV